jgi:hypothetical protein
LSFLSIPRFSGYFHLCRFFINIDLEKIIVSFEVIPELMKLKYPEKLLNYWAARTVFTLEI